MIKALQLCFFLFLSSCISEIDPATVSIKKPVVYCVFEEAKPWTLTLQWSKSLIDSAKTNYIANAEVIISGSDGTIRTLNHLGGGFYWSNQSLPQQNVIYSLKIIEVFPK